MNEWWNSLSSLLKFLWFLAIPSSVLFILQTILTIIGIGEINDVDVDTDSNLDLDCTDHDHSIFAGAASFKIFTLRNIITFFTTFSWIGIVFTTNGFEFSITLSLSLLISIALVLLISSLYYFFSRMTQEGNMDINKAINAQGQVYLTIPERRSDTGKVMVPVQGVLRELEALTDGDAIPTGEKVVVTGIVDNQYLLVEKITSLQEV
ncbi:NfeD family protein [Clostridium thermarum]|uniref:NfeD family protein n=1 Tax=Clostridium thermarum TaxID=1716543 RepID=UPI0011241F59|nr:NfeD family protein [Clostridium thermarum]